MPGRPWGPGSPCEPCGPGIAASIRDFSPWNWPRNIADVASAFVAGMAGSNGTGLRIAHVLRLGAQIGHDVALVAVIGEGACEVELLDGIGKGIARRRELQVIGERRHVKAVHDARIIQVHGHRARRAVDRADDGDQFVALLGLIGGCLAKAARGLDGLLAGDLREQRVDGRARTQTWRRQLWRACW